MSLLHHPSFTDLRLGSNDLTGLIDLPPPSTMAAHRLCQGTAHGVAPAAGLHIPQKMQLQLQPHMRLLRTLEHLRTLHLPDCPSLRAQQLASVLLACPHLTDLDVRGCKGLVPGEVGPCPPGEGPQRRSFDWLIMCELLLTYSCTIPSSYPSCAHG